jgi:hypothetical protein
MHIDNIVRNKQMYTIENKDQINLNLDVQPSKTCFYSRASSAIHSTSSIIIYLCATNVTW